MNQIPDQNRIIAAIERALLAVAIDPTQLQIGSLLDYVGELIKWNRRVNLTGGTSHLEFVRGPLFDALTLLKVLIPEGALVDVGSGGGLPGLPVALVHRGMRITLVEPRAKRASFLRHVTNLLGLDVEVRQQRAHELPGGAWNQAVAQAVWPAAKWLETACRLVAPPGYIYVMTTGPVEESDIPPGMRVDESARLERPWDRAPRHVTRMTLG